MRNGQLSIFSGNSDFWMTWDFRQHCPYSAHVHILLQIWMLFYFLSFLAWLSKLDQLYCCKKCGLASILISSNFYVSSGVPFLHAWNRTCSVIWNMLSDNVINRVKTCLTMPWDSYLIFIRVVITLGAAPMLSLSIFINCISQSHYDGKELLLYEISHFANVVMFWSLNGAKRVFHKSNICCLSHTIKFLELTPEVMFWGEMGYIGHKRLCHLLKLEFDLEMKSDKVNSLLNWSYKTSIIACILTLVPGKLWQEAPSFLGSRIFVWKC